MNSIIMFRSVIASSRRSLFDPTTVFDLLICLFCGLPEKSCDSQLTLFYLLLSKITLLSHKTQQKNN
jgi:hypothetical protein